MYHSVTFGSKNTYSDWHLVPDGRPVIAMPELKTNYVDIPGANKPLDLSDLLTKYPTYNNRQGDLKFHVLNGYNDWNVLYQTIANYVHGRRMQVTLEDDSDYYYEGRITVGEWTSKNDGTWSDITLHYELDPYKYAKVAYSKTETVDGSTTKAMVYDSKDIGRMPVVPEITVSNIGTGGVRIDTYNREIMGGWVSHNITQNGKYTFYDSVLSAIDPTNSCYMHLSGHGTANLTFRRGEL